MTLLGAYLSRNTILSITSISAYNFRTGPFSVAATVSTAAAGGTVLARLDEHGGFSLTVNPDSTIAFLTSDGQQQYTVSTGPTGILDDSLHTLVVTRNGTDTQILFDGVAQPCTSTGTGQPPLDVNTTAIMTIGTGPSGLTFTGMVLNVGLWNNVLAGNAIVEASFARLGSLPGTQGYWMLNGDYSDASPNANNAIPNKPVLFLPCVESVWTVGADPTYAFCQMSADGNQQTGVAQTRSFVVQAGTRALFYSIMSTEDQPAFPAGAEVGLTDPNGNTYTTQLNTDTELVVLSVDAQPWAVTVLQPPAGTWTVSVAAPANVGFVLQIQTCPTTDVVDTVTAALSPLYSSTQTAEGVEGFFTVLAMVAAAALAGVVVAAGTFLTFGAALPALAAGIAAFATTGLVTASYSLPAFDINSVNETSEQVTGMSGFVVASEPLLVIDADVDGPTGLAASGRRQLLYPAVATSPFNHNHRRLLKSDDTRANVKDHLARMTSGYVTASGHGEVTALLGWTDPSDPGELEQVLAVGDYDPSEVSGKIFHFLACSTGSPDNGLGMDLVANGAVAFFGYSDKVAVSLAYTTIFASCDVQIDLALLGGQTCGQAYSAADAQYTAQVTYLRGIGQMTVAAVLLRNQNLLVAPSTNAIYGDPTATLNVPTGTVTAARPEPVRELVTASSR